MGARPLDVARIRADFPILAPSAVQGLARPLVYLDNGATTQKPEAVLRAMDDFGRTSNANIHRGVYALSERATRLYEAGREAVREFMNAASPEEIIFTKGTTESVNLVASSWGRANLKQGDVVLVTEAEHHSNLVPWQLAAAAAGAKLKATPILPSGELDADAFGRILGEGRVAMVAVGHVSNVLGTVHPIRDLAAAAHERGALVFVDGAQAAPHLPIDVRDLGVDFYAFSAHKAYGPMGVGALYGRRELLAAMPPYQGGGDMIETVSIERSTYAGLPAKFEAGTPNVAGVHGLTAAIDYVAGLGQGADRRARLLDAFRRVAAHENDLLRAATAGLSELPGLRVVGEAAGKAAIVSFTVPGVHPHDVATFLDAEGVAVRAGHHCCMPLMAALGLSATTRASFGLYNEAAEIEPLVRGVRKAMETLS